MLPHELLTSAAGVILVDMAVEVKIEFRSCVIELSTPIILSKVGRMAYGEGVSIVASGPITAFMLKGWSINPI